MKPGGPIARTTPLRADPAKQKAWQERSRSPLRTRSGPQVADAPRKPLRTVTQPSMAPLRAETIALRGGYCRACGTTRNLQMDHVVPRSQGRAWRYDIRNCTMLCETHHTAKTEKRLQYRAEWLDPDQLAFLADIGWVDWDSDGLPFGRGWRGFAPLNTTATPPENGEQHG